MTLLDPYPTLSIASPHSPSCPPPTRPPPPPQLLRSIASLPRLQKLKLWGMSHLWPSASVVQELASCHSSMLTELNLAFCGVYDSLAIRCEERERGGEGEAESKECSAQQPSQKDDQRWSAEAGRRSAVATMIDTEMFLDSHKGHKLHKVFATKHASFPTFPHFTNPHPTTHPPAPTNPTHPYTPQLYRTICHVYLCTQHHPRAQPKGPEGP